MRKNHNYTKLDRIIDENINTVSLEREIQTLREDIYHQLCNIKFHINENDENESKFGNFFRGIGSGIADWWRNGMNKAAYYNRQDQATNDKNQAIKTMKYLKGLAKQNFIDGTTLNNLTLSINKYIAYLDQKSKEQYNRNLNYRDGSTNNDYNWQNGAQNTYKDPKTGIIYNQKGEAINLKGANKKPTQSRNNVQRQAPTSTPNGTNGATQAAMPTAQNRETPNVTANGVGAKPKAQQIELSPEEDQDIKALQQKMQARYGDPTEESRKHYKKLIERITRREILKCL